MIIGAVSTLTPFVASAQPVEWTISMGGNGHLYELVSGVHTWHDARALAAARTIDGRPGRLATIQSANELGFLIMTYGDSVRGKWLGAYQPDPTSSPTSGWVWITGEPWVFTNWINGGPNDFFGAGSESYLEFYGATNAALGGWDDVRANWASVPSRRGFIVEYPSLCVADIASPLGELTFADVNQFLGAFVLQQPSADLAEPYGAWSFADISAFLIAFTTGCP